MNGSGGNTERGAGMAWTVREARARFGALLDASISEGPQIVTRRGVETAVLAPIGEWRRLREETPLTLKELLLAPEPRTETLAPPRKERRYRPPPVFD